MANIYKFANMYLGASQVVESEQRLRLIFH